MTPVPTTRLANGAEMPLVGFGTHPMRDAAARDAVLTALDVGYRSIDTATRYRNEAAVGAALAATTVPRGDIFVTTKLPPDAVGLEHEHLEASMEALGVEQIDLWLMHWPPGGTAGVGAFQRMIEAREQGLVRAIGVSNYRLALMAELERETGHHPEIVQLQWSPVHFSSRFLEKCAERRIVVGAHSPFRSARMDDPVLTRIAHAHDVTVNQVIMRWNVQHGVAAVPKSAHRERMTTNLDVLGFQLSEIEMAAIDGLSELE